MQTYTLAGFQVSTAEQARVMLLMFMMKKDERNAELASYVLKKLSNGA